MSDVQAVPGERAAPSGAAERAEPGRRQAQALLVGGLHLGALSAFAVAQPLFDLLGRNSTFLAIRDLSTSDIVVFSVGLIVVPPAALLLVEALAALAGPRVRHGVHLGFVALLAALVALQAVARVADGPGLGLVAGSVVLGGLFAVAYARARPLRTMLTVLAPAPLVFAGLFLFASPVSRLVLPAEAQARSARVESRAPVVVVLFDEFSSTSLLDATGAVDRSRYPRFAELARQSTWFRNATTVSPWTEQAVPAILAGKLPDENRLPIYRDHPNNLFTLLGASYDLQVQEPLTRLCPGRLCGNTTARSIPPGLGPLLSDLGIVYLHVALPEALTRDLPSISNRWGNFRGDRVLVGVNRARRSAAANFEDFVRAIAPGRRPRLSFLHVFLPHFPWQYFPSGRRYLRRSETIPGLNGERWAENERLVFQARKRYLLQVGFVDRLLGQLVDRLRATGLYDRSLIVITADHGVSLRAGGTLRSVNAENAEDIAFVPLFVKVPGQRRGRVVDAPVRTVDVLPTIADGLGIRLPFSTDGRSGFAGGSLAGRTITIEDERFDLRRLKARRRTFLARQSAAFGGGWGRLLSAGPFGTLLGRRTDELQVAAERGSVEIDDESAFRDVDLGSSLVPAFVSGRLRGAGQPRALAVALNGRVEAIGTTYRRGGAVRFAALLPESAFRNGRNLLELFAISETTVPVPLVGLGGTSGGATFTLLRASNGGRIESSDGRTLRIAQNAVQGGFDTVAVESRELRLSGWAADVAARAPRESVLVFANGRFVTSSSVAVARPELGPGLRRAGFDFRVSLGQLAAGQGASTVRVFAVVGGVASELGCPVEGPGGRGVPRYRRTSGLLEDGSTVILQLPAPCPKGASASGGPVQQLVTAADVARQRAGSPGRALFRWWRAVQQEDRAGYLAGFEGELRQTIARDPSFRRALQAFSASMQGARPTILRVERHGSTATIFASIEFREAAGPARVTTTRVPRAFELVREGGDWRLRDDFFAQTSLPPALRR